MQTSVSPSTEIAAALDALSLPCSARLWFYVTNRSLTADERLHIQTELNMFVAGWEAHGTPLKASATVLLNDLLVLAVDEDPQPATGCSIDRSVAFLRALPATRPSLADLDVFGRGWVFAWNAGQARWVRHALHDFWALAKAGEVPPSTPILDTTASTLGDPVVLPVGESWHAHMW